MQIAHDQLDGERRDIIKGNAIQDEANGIAEERGPVCKIELGDARKGTVIELAKGVKEGIIPRHNRSRGAGKKHHGIYLQSYVTCIVYHDVTSYGTHRKKLFVYFLRTR